MRYINKNSSPDFFEQEKRDFPLTDNSSWKEFQNPCKSQLKKHLSTEQDGLCAYCECDLSATSSHIEHVIPRAREKSLKFAYENLVISCDGVFLQEENTLRGESCGHNKDRGAYDECLFLNPVIERDISNYFVFDADTGQMKAAAGDKLGAAELTIDILNLDVPYLREARKNAREVLVEGLYEVEDDQLFFRLLEDELSAPREFISFLQYCFLTGE